MTKRIVTIDDDENMRALVRYRLGREGYDVEEYTDGQAAVEGLRATDDDPDLIVLDVMMPRLDGKRLLRQIRNDELSISPETPVIMVTSRGREEDVLSGFESGASDYVTKPFSPDELLARARRYLDE